ncbi:hypothetical protein [Wolbachia endosymbiont of Chironomus riparius]|uniref:hypothetical protein n=1 Tax=Wolbachia endosymbiont of Chironomus riparius TaxID=2883238 RepID=UPI00209F951C|nr:hypothetical protein [Wolbachia endosymbiont of Chironomus riparius]
MSKNSNWGKKNLKRDFNDDSKISQKTQQHITGKDITSPIVPDNSKIEGKFLTIQVGQKQNNNQNIKAKNSFATFTGKSINSVDQISDSVDQSDRVSTSNDSGISSISHNSTNTIPKTIENYNPEQQKFAGIRKKINHSGVSKKIQTPTVPADFQTNNPISSKAKENSETTFSKLALLRMNKLDYQGYPKIETNEHLQDLHKKQINVEKELNQQKEIKKVLPILERQLRKECSQKIRELKKEFSEVTKAKWQAKFDLRIEKNRDTELDKIAENTNSKFIDKLINKADNWNGKYSYMEKDTTKNPGFHYRTLGEIKDRLLFGSSSDMQYTVKDMHNDKRILLKYTLHEAKTFSQDKNIGKQDKDLLKTIIKDLKKELKQSKNDFNPQSDKYIQQLKRNRPPQSGMNSLFTKNILNAPTLGNNI